MRRFQLLGYTLLLAAAPLLAQGNVRVRPAAPSGSDARTNPGGIRVASPNILYPGSPNGGQPGSILTPGTPRTPAASPLPATPGAAPQPKPPHQSQRGHRRQRGYPPIFGYGYGGIYLDNGSGPTEISQPEDTAEDNGGNSNANRVQRDNPPPRSRTYEVHENAEGKVEMTSIGASRQASQDYWLIALRGGLIYAVERYWRQDETFRFLTLNGKEFVISPAEFDLEFTKRLNADRGKEFREP